MSAPQHDGQAATGQEGVDLLTQLGLRLFQIAVAASHVARVPKIGFATHRQVGQRDAQCCGTGRRTGSTAIAPDTLVHGKPHQGDAATAVGIERAHHMVPAQTGTSLLAVRATGPFKR